MTSKSLSIVIPVYNAGEKLKDLIKDILVVLKGFKIDIEIILVNDGCPYNSELLVQELTKEHSIVKGIFLSRNFGQHPAILAGLSEAKGESIIVMDCDYQDDPKYIIDLIKKADQGYDIVFTKKRKRKHGIIKNIFAHIFNLVFNYLSNNQSSDSNVGNFSLISQKVNKSINNYNDHEIHYILMLRWLGFKSTSIDIEHLSRDEGKSSYSFKKLLKHSIVAITYSSDKLLYINIYSGVLLSFLSLIFGIATLIKYYLQDIMAGWTSLVILIIFSLGITQLSFGIIGLYLSKTFQQVKTRPRFIIDEIIE